MVPDTNGTIVVTGGGGFVGSHLVDRLTTESADVTVIDDFSMGNTAWVPDDVTVVDADLSASPTAIASALPKRTEVMYHLASRTAVNDADPRGQFEANVEMTNNLLEVAQSAGVNEIVFTSSSTVYGEAPRPTPEDYAPLEPISMYGASKLASEGILSTAAHTMKVDVRVFRFANVVGPRLRGAVIPDFIEKLRADPNRLLILGNGRQEKSYLHISDCVDGMLSIENRPDKPFEVFNLGTRSTTSVIDIADIVSEEMGLEPEYEYTGGRRGWEGDVPKMRLAIEKIADRGWEPAMESDEAVRHATRELVAELG